MIKSLFVLCACLALSACAAIPALLGMAAGPAPQAIQVASAPLARTGFDESAYRAALAAANTTRLTINVIIARGGLVRNSPQALRVRQGLVALRDSLRAARALLDALNDPVSTLSPSELAAKAEQYREAMRAAAAAAEEIGEAMSGGSASADDVDAIRDGAAQIRAAVAAG